MNFINKMGIKNKVALAVVFCTAVFLFMMALFARTVLLENFQVVEHDMFKRNAGIVHDTISANIDNYESKVADWAAWDDAYQYVQNKNNEFEKVNFQPQALPNLKIDILAFYDLKGLSVKTIFRDLPGHEKNDLSVALEEHFYEGSPIFQFNTNSESHKGILKTSKGLLFFAARPITDSSMSKPIKGTLVFGRFLNQDLVQIIANTVHIPDLILTDLQQAESLKKIAVYQSRDYYFKTLIDNQAMTYFRIYDYYGNEAALLSAVVPRKNYANAVESLNTLILITALCFLIFLFVLIRMVNKIVIDRLVNLSQEVLHIEFDKEHSVSVVGADEVALVAASVNKMLNRLNKKAEDLKILNQLVLKQQEAMIVSAKMSALGEMAGGVAHEINSPLAIIKLRTEMALHELSGDLGPERIEKMKKYLQVVDATVKRISKIIHGLKIFSHENKKIEKSLYNINNIVTDALELCYEKFKSNGINIIFIPHTDLLINCQHTELTQVLVNLLNNSFDALKGTDKWIRIEIKNTDEQVMISVVDSGQGIPSEIRKKIMEPFFTTKEVGKGTGLGLSISKGIVESQGGAFYLDETSSNTSFVIALPIDADRLIYSKAG